MFVHVSRILKKKHEYTVKINKMRAPVTTNKSIHGQNEKI